MIDAFSSKSRQIISKSGRVIYTRAKRLRGSVVILPFVAAVLVSFVYLRLRFPPLWLQDFVVFSAPLLLGISVYCRTWIYRFPAGAPLLAMSLGGALFFPFVVCNHIRFYDVTDNGIGLTLAVCVWGLSTYCSWRLFQPSPDGFWNTVLERFRGDPRRWLVIAFVPLVWAGYAFGAFQLVDTQFDASSGQVSRIPRTSTCVTSRPGFLGAPWRRASACPAASIGRRGATPPPAPPRRPRRLASIWFRLPPGVPACGRGVS
jgi:hypothetical protein